MGVKTSERKQINKYIVHKLYYKKEEKEKEKKVEKRKRKCPALRKSRTKTSRLNNGVFLIANILSPESGLGTFL